MIKKKRINLKLDSKKSDNLSTSHSVIDSLNFLIFKNHIFIYIQNIFMNNGNTLVK